MSDPFSPGSDAIPDGFKRAEGRGPFSTHNGPSYRGTVDGKAVMALRVLKRHCNSMGFLHGGMASAFADGAMAWAVWRETRKTSVTLKLTQEYFEIVPEGHWLEAYATAQQSEGGIVHVQARLIRGRKTLVGRADGVFRTLSRRKAE